MYHRVRVASPECGATELGSRARLVPTAGRAPDGRVAPEKRNAPSPAHLLEANKGSLAPATPPLCSAARRGRAGSRRCPESSAPALRDLAVVLAAPAQQ